MPESLDIASLQRMVADSGGDAEFVADLIDDYLANAQELLNELHQTLRVDTAAATRAAHSLKGTSATFGATRVRDEAALIEVASRGGEIETAAIHLENVKTELERVTATLREAQEKLRIDGAI